MCEDVHPGRVHVAEPWHILFCLPIYEIESPCEELFIYGFHTLLWKRSGIFYCLFANFSKLWIHCCVVFAGGFAFQYTAGTELLAEVWILRIIFIVRFL